MIMHKIPFVLAILSMLAGVFIAILFGINEDAFKDHIDAGLAQNSMIQQIANPAEKAAKLASEVSDIKSVNSILVGGPCANAASATVLGNPADCAAGFTPGEGRIELYEHANGNVAMLVAGYSAVDTRNTATVVANYKDYKAQLKGTKVVVKKTNNVLTVAAPVTA